MCFSVLFILQFQDICEKSSILLWLEIDKTQSSNLELLNHPQELHAVD